QLDNPVSMNVIDICPVGALTSRDFRFKARAWDMSFTDTVCPGCANGCNIRVGVRDNEILRLEPRPNPNVNDFWMCDEGRLTAYPPVNAADRVSGAMQKTGDTHTKIELSSAVHAIATALKKYKADEIAFIASANATLEDNFVFVELAKTKGIKHIGYFTNERGNDEKLLIKRDKTPNAYALKLLSVQPFGDDFTASLRNGSIKAVYSLEDDFLGRTDLTNAFGKVTFFAAHATSMNATAKRADIVLPASAWAEKEGVFINSGGWINLLKPAVATTHTVRGFDHLNQSRLDKYGTQFDRWAQRKKVDAIESWHLTQMIGAEIGKKTDFRFTEDVFEAVVAKLPSLSGLDYDKLGSEGLPVNGIGRERKPIEYREVYQESTEAELV
ncbi:MAG TPA: molybdopterin-dependent oxidoreductase, partial [Candidatus Kapabacteria bacterium]